MPPQDSSASTHGLEADPDPDAHPTSPPNHHNDSHRLQRTNTFSMAGAPTYDPPAYCHRTDSYVQPEYRTYQEPYEQERSPIWGLAAPLPRTLRPGMRPRRPSDAQTLQEHLPTINNAENFMRHVQSNASHQPYHGHMPRRPSMRRPTLSRPPATESIQEDNLPTHRPSEDDADTSSAEAADTGAQDVSHLSRVDLLKAAAANAWHQHEEQPDTDSERTAGQIQQEISNHASHDFATEAPSRPPLAPIQESPRPSLIDKPEVEALRKQLQAQPDFIPHRSRSIARPPTECDVEAFPNQPTHRSSHMRKSSHDSLRSRSPESAHTNHDQHGQEFLNTWSKYRYYLREPLAEFLGVFVMMFTGLAANLMNQINNVNDPPQVRYGDFNSTNLTWSWACMAAIYIAGGVSGAHLSPVVTVTLCIFRGFPWRNIWKYAIAQFLGCFIAALMVYVLYRDAIILTANAAGVDAFEALFARSSVFHSSPTDGVGNSTVFFTQGLMVGLFSLTVLALGDDHNSPPGAGMNAFVVGLFVFVISAAFPYNTGASFNPFRDFAPRLVVSMVWARTDIWTFRSCYWIWGCWLAPLVGSLAGAAVYDVCIFTGGESPVNYQQPGSMLLAHTRRLKEKAFHYRHRDRTADEEQGRRNYGTTKDVD